MKESNKLFDTIRIKPRRGAPSEQEAASAHPACDWDGCDDPGIHKAPKGAAAEGQFHNFCLKHVRHYNKAYNYFSGMSDDEIAAHASKMNAPGSKETWAFGSNRMGESKPEPRKFKARDYTGKRINDPNNLFARVARNQARAKGGSHTEREITLTGQDRMALETLGLEGRKTREDIKSAYKSLVKIHHPDANGGDKRSEERLRAIISAYNHLKAKGLV